jgi:tRNA pseudouridine55 synthase
MFGLLNLNKPAWKTSRDCVSLVERIVRPCKVGHAGTLDPLATGVLVLGLGAATRLVEYVQRMDKAYRGTFLLGRTSDTEDASGEVTLLSAPPVPTREGLEALTGQFLGTIWQRPPDYSAVKVQGKRAYALARQGERVEIAPRPIEVYELRIERYEYPELVLSIRCGSGTYVRTLARDLAKAAGTDCVMTALCRERIGPFRLAAALDSEYLVSEKLDRHAIESRLLSSRLAVSDLHPVEISTDDALRLTRGQPIARRPDESAVEAVALNPAGEPYAILSAAGDAWRGTKVFGTPDSYSRAAQTRSAPSSSSST